MHCDFKHTVPCAHKAVENFFCVSSDYALCIFWPRYYSHFHISGILFSAFVCVHTLNYVQETE